MCGGVAVKHFVQRVRPPLKQYNRLVSPSRSIKVRFEVGKQKKREKERKREKKKKKKRRKEKKKKKKKKEAKGHKNNEEKYSQLERKTEELD